MFVHNTWAAPLKIMLILILLVNEVGMAGLLGFLVLIILLPINFVLAAKTGKYQKEGLQISDERLKNSNEMLQGIKLLKLYAWEGWFCDLIEGIRKREMNVKVKNALLDALISFLAICTITIVAFVTFVSYVKIFGNELTASKTFTSLALMNLMRFPLILIPDSVRVIINAHVSSKRLIPYLTAPEIDKLREEAPVYKIEDEVSASPNPQEFRIVYPKPSVNEKMHQSSDSPTIDVRFPNDEADRVPIAPDFCIPPHIAVVINNASFSWDADASEPTISNIDINVPKGKLSMVVGPVGNGKSSLVNALLGEMATVGGQVIWADDCTIAYAAQKPWLLNDTVKNNILFGRPFDRERYEAILEACAMKSDLDVFPAGLVNLFYCMIDPHG